MALAFVRGAVASIEFGDLSGFRPRNRCVGPSPTVMMGGIMGVEASVEEDLTDDL